MPKLFVTGATGYIGGDALYAIAHAHPDYEITALVRNSNKGGKVASQYASIRLVYGDLDSTDLITEEAAKADVVCHWANADHPGAATAIVAGLVKKTEAGGKGYYIHTSGTGILMIGDAEKGTYGIRSEKVFDDWSGVEEVTNLPDAASHRNVDKIVLAAGKDYYEKVSTAIVCPPTIYGPGRGPDNQRSHQVYEMSRVILTRGKGFQVEDGQNLWTQIHVHDLSNVFLRLVEEAVKGGGKATWGPKGYYFAENGDFVWGDVAAAITKYAYEKKFIRHAEIDKVSSKVADNYTKFGAAIWGQNSRGRAVRARKVLGWEPAEKSLFELIPSIVDGEARRLELTAGHAAEAAG